MTAAENRRRLNLERAEKGRGIPGERGRGYAPGALRLSDGREILAARFSEPSPATSGRSARLRYPTERAQALA